MATDLVCWPYWLPVPERTDYSYEPVDQTNVRSEMDVGVLVRRAFTTDETIINCQIIVEDCEAYWFEAFEQWMLNQGSQWFGMPLWVAGVKQNYVCQMVDRPKMSEVRGFTNFITFAVRVQKRVLSPVSGLGSSLLNVLPAWPRSLPLLQDGYSYTLRNTDLKTATNLTSIRLPQFDIDETTITAKLYLDRTQQNVFEWFEREILNHGARWFKLPLWIGGVMNTHIARLTKRPKITLDNFWCSVDLEMEVENRVLMDKKLVGWLALLSPEDLLAYRNTILGVLNSMSTLLVPDFWMPVTQCLGGKILYEWGLS